jgi:hypothetical protein
MYLVISKVGRQTCLERRGEDMDLTRASGIEELESVRRRFWW